MSGAREYLAARPVYFLLVEYYPKGLRAGGVDPLQLLTLLTYELGYTCFDLRCKGSKPNQRALRLDEFVRKYPAMAANEFGTWTDLLCTRFDLL